MTEDQGHYGRLLHAYLTGEVTETELEELFDYIRDFPYPASRLLVEASHHTLQELTQDKAVGNAPLNPKLSERMLARLMTDIRQTPVVPIEDTRRRKRHWLGWVAAAVFLLMAGGAVYYLAFSKTASKQPIASTQYNGDVPPAHKGAVLHLSNGSTIALDSVRNGTVATQGTIRAVKIDGELKYEGTGSGVVYNTVTTARGQQWQLTLPDGTRVWLNAASSITYPTSFSGSQREVTLSGEAYFEVARKTTQPFSVKTRDMKISVLGTVFDVMAYEDEDNKRTTLIQGSVRVDQGSDGRKLSPGQQAIVNKDKAIVVDPQADIEKAVAWKTGLFKFNHTDIRTIMKEISRWYDIDVIYEIKDFSGDYGGLISRNLNLSEFINLLEGSGIHHYRIEGRKLIVLP